MKIFPSNKYTSFQFFTWNSQTLVIWVIVTYILIVNYILIANVTKFLYKTMNNHEAKDVDYFFISLAPVENIIFQLLKKFTTTLQCHNSAINHDWIIDLIEKGVLDFTVQDYMRLV